VTAPPSSPGKTLFKVFLLLFTAASCSLFGLRWLVSLDVHALASPPAQTPLPQEPSDGRSSHLGTALIPTSTPLSQARTYEWRAESLTPPEYRVAYGLGESLARSLQHDHQAYGRKLRFRALGPDRFTYHAPPGCQTDMRCIYAELMRTNAEPVHQLGQRFVEHIRERDLGPIEAAELIVTFVQRIHYEQPGDQPFGVLPPALVPAQDRGDCDSKAVLAVMLLQHSRRDARSRARSPAAPR